MRFHRLTLPLGLVLILTSMEALSQLPAPLGATLQLPGDVSSGWALPATVEMLVTHPGASTFTGSNNKLERGSPFYSGQVDRGATFYRCDTVRGFPQRQGSSSPFINRLGGSSFIAVAPATTPDGTPTNKVWICASVGAFRTTGTVTAEWEYQIRYFSGDPATGSPATLVIGTVPNANFFTGETLPNYAVNLLASDLPDLVGSFGEEMNFPLGFIHGSSGSLPLDIENRGSGYATGKIDIQFYLSLDDHVDSVGDIYLGTLEVSNIDLAPGGQRTVHFDVTLPGSGLASGQKFLARIDSAEAIAESNEGNNVTASLPPGPDLAGTLMEIRFAAGARPLQRGTMTLRLENIGLTSVEGNVAVDIYFSTNNTLEAASDILMSPTTSLNLNLNPAESQLSNLEIIIPGSLLPGTYFVLVMLDPGQHLAENNRANNLIIGEPLVVGGAELLARTAMLEASTPIAHMPGDLRTAEVRFFNASSQRWRENVTYSLFLSADTLLDFGNDRLLTEKRIKSLDLLPGEGVSERLEIILPNGIVPPLDKSGARYLLVLMEADGALESISEADRTGVSEQFFMGYQIVNVATHGFNPLPLTSGTWESFRENWRRMGRLLDQTAAPSSFFHGRVKTKVPVWESSDGFFSGFLCLFAAKLAEAVALDAISRGDDLKSLPYIAISEILKSGTKIRAGRSRMIANAAANSIVNELFLEKYLSPNPDISRGFQRLHLIGHSRGASVNAQVSKLLAARGYQVDEFTSLDGFSTDWPDDAGLLGDFDIGRATVAEHSINYRVELGLAEWVLSLIELEDPDSQAFLDEMLKLTGDLTAKTVAGRVALAIADLYPDPGTRSIMRTFDIRAPEWSRFEVSRIMMSPVDRTHHVNVTPLFMVGPEFYDSYLGRNRFKVAPPTEAFQLHSVNRVKPHSSHFEISDEDLEFWDFRDGDFTDLSDLQQKAVLYAADSSGNRFVDAWLRILADPVVQVESMWTVSGEVVLEEIDGNPLVHLASKEPSASLSQPVDLGGGGRVLHGRVLVESGRLSSQLKVLWKGQEWSSIDIDRPPEFFAFSLPLVGMQGVGELGLRLVGGAQGDGIVLIDDLRIEVLRPRISSLQLMGQAGVSIRLEPGVPGEFLLEASQDLHNWEGLLTIDDDGSGAVLEPGSAAAGEQLYFRIRRIR